MRRIHIYIITALLMIGSNAYSTPSTIVFFRHAEKPVNEKSRNLSASGERRAQLLARAVLDKRYAPAFSLPQVLIAASSREGKSRRSKQTLKPLAKMTELSIYSEYGRDEEEELVQELLEDSKYDGKTVLISWNHDGIPKMLEHLGVKNAATNWDSDIYDQFWVVKRRGHGWQFIKVPQQLLPNDSDTCDRILIEQ